jgi:hypothetical protein
MMIPCPGAESCVSEWLGDLSARWRQDRDRVRALIRDVKEQFQGVGLNLDLGSSEPLIIDPDPARPGAEVILDPAAQRLLDPLGDRASRPSPDFSEIYVLLSWADPERVDGQVAVRAGDYRVGVLAAADSGAFRAFLEEGSRLGRPVVTEAFRDRAPGKRWRLTVYRPGRRD